MESSSQQQASTSLIVVSPFAGLVLSTSPFSLFGVSPSSTLHGMPIVYSIPLYPLTQYPGQTQVMALDPMNGQVHYHGDIDASCDQPSHRSEGCWIVRYPLFQPGGQLDFQKLTDQERQEVEMIAQEIARGMRVLSESYQRLVKLAEKINATSR
jgi:hypothetical protein